METQGTPLLQANIQRNYEDFKIYFRYWMRRERTWLQWPVWILIGGGFLLSIWFFIHLSYGNSIVMFLYALGLLIFYAMIPRLRYRQSKTAYEAHSAYTFFEDRLHVLVSDRGTEAEVTALYSHYTRAMETAYAFYLKAPEKHYIIFPKRCFSPEQVPILHDLFARQFGDQFTMEKKTERLNQEGL